MELMKNPGIVESLESEEMEEKEQAPAAEAAQATEKQGAVKAPATKTTAATKTKAVPKAKATTKTAPASGESLVQDSDADLISTVVNEVENLGEEKAFETVPALLENIDSDYFRLGGVLAVIQVHGWFADRGYETFRAYIENECGMAYRKSMYLIAIYNGLVSSGVPWSKVKALGWTKLKELATLLTKENVDEWVGVASNMTTLQLQEYIKNQAKQASAQADAPSGEVQPTVSTMTFKVHPDQRETIRAALDKVKAIMETDSDTVALEHMSLDYLAGSGSLKTAPTLKALMTGKSAEEVLAAFEEVFPDIELTATISEE